ncbi:MAG: hypothetical protein ACWA45_10885 [Flavobacteriales bacterium]
MKKNLLWQSFVFVLTVLLFITCDNEPVEGEFLEGCDVVNSPVEGQITASIIEQEPFASIPQNPEEDSQFTYADLIIHANGFTHLRIESFSSSNEFMHLDIANPQVGNFDLATTNEEGFVDNINYHELFQTNGIYRDGEYNDDNSLYNYVTYAPNGGSGNVRITKFDEENELVSGFFNMVAKRKTVDEEGNVILGDDGLPVLETVTIECGSFNNIKWEVHHVEGEFVESNFFAKIDGEEFVETMVNASKTVVTGVPMVKLVATDGEGNKIRIDIPEDIGTGTFNMQSISNGTELIAMYNPIVIGENLTSSPGTITITEFNPFIGKLEANFEFTGSDPLGIDQTVVEVTEGYFQVDYLPNIEVNNIITAEVNGVPFVSNNAQTSSSIFNNVRRVLIQGIDLLNPDIEDDTDKSITFILPEIIEEGTYNFSTALIDGSEVIAYYSPDTENIDPIIVDNGSITITNSEAIDDIIILEGTFNFTVLDTSQDPEVEYTVVNGTFSMQIL